MSASDRALAALGPGMSGEAGAQLAALVRALLGPLDAVDAALTATDGSSTIPLFNMATTPFPRWLAQYAGVVAAPSLSDAQVRILAAGATALTKGTTAGIKAAVGATLTGTREVHITERVGGDAYALAITTYSVETPNPTATQAAAQAVIPVGIVLTYTVASGWSWEEMTAEAPITWDAAHAQGMTWEQLGAHVPND